MKDGIILHSVEQNQRLEVRLEAKDLEVFYGNFQAVQKLNMKIFRHRVLALIGPSGCGKSSLLRSFNRMNDLVPNAFYKGEILLDGQNILDPKENVVNLRKRVGMVFQKPNPFPSSVFNNVAWGPKINGYTGNIRELVEWALKSAALWDEVKDKLKQSGLALSGGQQQRLCIARAIAMQPEVILMDEPCSALDPISTHQVENLIRDLSNKYTIVMVTHNMQQASRLSDDTAFMYRGELVEHGNTRQIFENPKEKLTQDYLSGIFG